MTLARPIVAVLPQGSSDPQAGLGGLGDRADLRLGADAESLREALSEASALLVWDFRVDWLRDAWPQARRLEWIHAASAGVDALLVPEVVDSDVVVTNSRGVFDRPIAEHVLGVLLALTKDLPNSIRLQDRKQWQHRETGRLEGLRALVVGAGGIGRATARLLAAVGVEATVVGRRGRHDPEVGDILAGEQLDEALPGADAVVLAAPLTPETRGMFGAERFAAMRRGSWFVNVGRGALVDEPALVAALSDGQLGAAALDVFAEEPLPTDSPLWGMGNVIVTPHMSGDFRGWREALGALFVDNFERWRRGEPLRNVVDKQRGYVA